MIRIPPLDVERHPGQAAKRLAYYEAQVEGLKKAAEEGIAVELFTNNAAEWEQRAKTLREEFARVGRCRRCGRLLTKAESIDRSLGGVCARKEKP